MIRKVDAIESLNPEVGFSFDHEKGIIEWGSDDPQPTEDEIDTEQARLQVLYDAQKYARNRASAYPSTGDQLDMMYKDTKNSTTTHADAVEAVKTKWPKNNTGPVE